MAKVYTIKDGTNPDNDSKYIEATDTVVVKVFTLKDLKARRDWLATELQSTKDEIAAVKLALTL